MINLIPIEQKKEIERDFRSRSLIASLMMLAFLIFISLIAMLPAFIMSLEKKISVNKKLEMQKNEVMPEIDQKAQVEIKELDSRIALLEKARKNKYVFSEQVINEILSKKTPGVKINRIFYENDSLGGKRISISGLAQNREQLLLFRRALESDSSFRDINLPISNFVKGRDIEFNLNLIST